MLDQTMDWKAAEEVARYWGRPFALKGVMSVADARRAVDIGAAAIMVSNHGGRQLDGSRTPFDQLAEIVDAVGDKIDVICDGGIRRGSTSATLSTRCSSNVTVAVIPGSSTPSSALSTMARAGC